MKFIWVGFGHKVLSYSLFDLTEFVNASNRNDTFEFLDMKLNLGELIEKRDALKLCEHFELSEDVTSFVQSSGNPGLAVLESLEELQHFTASNISPVLKVANDLALEEAVSVLQRYKKRLTLPGGFYLVESRGYDWKIVQYKLFEFCVTYSPASH